MHALLACVFVHRLHAWCWLSVEEGADALELGSWTVRDCWELNPCPAKATAALSCSLTFPTVYGGTLRAHAHTHTYTHTTALCVQVRAQVVSSPFSDWDSGSQLRS